MRKRCIRRGQGRKAIGQQFIEVDGVAIGHAAQGLVVVAKTGLIEAHLLRQFAKDLAVGFGFALRRDRGAIEQHVGVAVAHVNVPVFELCGGGQDVVGVVGRVSLEMLQHDSEQVFACKALHHLGRVWRNRHRVAVVDDQCLDRRPERRAALAQQVVADGAHVERAWRAAAQQVRPLQCGALDWKAA